jgi:hypothetical protein
MKILVFLAFIVLALLAGTGDFQEQVKQAEHYCDMVNSGAWPNYESRNCEGKQ